jgi:hypothetical protein
MKRGDPNFGTTPSSRLIYERHREYRKKSKNTHMLDGIAGIQQSKIITD